MKWDNFIQKIKDFKSQGVSPGLSASTVTRLLYAGAFDEMLSDELKAIPAIQRYARMRTEALTALKSKAELPKATGDEHIGLNKVESIPHLVLWRHSVNPLSKYDLSNFCKNFLAHEGFLKAASESGEITWFRPEQNGASQIDIRTSWHGLFDASGKWKTYSSQRTLAMIAIVVDVKKSTFQGNKESLVVDLFNGTEFIQGLRVWPARGQSKVSEDLANGLTKHSVGLVYLQPKPWNDRSGGAIIKWTKVRGI